MNSLRPFLEFVIKGCSPLQYVGIITKTVSS